MQEDEQDFQFSDVDSSFLGFGMSVFVLLLDTGYKNPHSTSKVKTIWVVHTDSKDSLRVKRIELGLGYSWRVLGGGGC